MPAKRVYMLRVGEILRLKFAANLPNREVARPVARRHRCSRFWPDREVRSLPTTCF
jgi:hypothetical protein